LRDAAPFFLATELFIPSLLILYYVWQDLHIQSPHVFICNDWTKGQGAQDRHNKKNTSRTRQKIFKMEKAEASF